MSIVVQLLVFILLAFHKQFWFKILCQIIVL